MSMLVVVVCSLDQDTSKSDTWCLPLGCLNDLIYDGKMIDILTILSLGCIRHFIIHIYEIYFFLSPMNHLFRL